MTKVETILAQVDGLLDAAYEVVNGRKLWKEVTPLVNIAAEMLLEERKDYFWPIPDMLALCGIKVNSNWKSTMDTWGYFVAMKGHSDE